MPAFLRIKQLRPAAFASARSRRGEPGLGSLAHQGALELCQSREQMLPLIVLVSIPSLSERSSTPRSWSERISTIKSESDRPSRSSRQTTS